MTLATPAHLLIDGTILDRATLQPAGRICMEQSNPLTMHELNDPGCSKPRTLRLWTEDMDTAAAPGLLRAVMGAYIDLGYPSTVFHLPDGTVIDNRIPDAMAEELYAAARPHAAGMTEASQAPGRFFRITSTSTAYILNLHRRFDGLVVEAGCALQPGLCDDFAAQLAPRGETGTSIRLRMRRLVTTLDELQSVLAEADTLRDTWADATPEAIRKEADARQKAFLQRITAQLKPLGFRKKAMHWTYTRPDGHHVDFHAQKSAYSDGFYFNLRLTEPEQHPWYMGLLYERPLGTLLDWQTIPGEDFDALLRAVMHTRILPMISEPVSALVSAQGGMPPC